MPESNDSRIAAIWKWVATLLAGAVAGGVPFFVMAASKVDAAQVSHMIAAESPYVQDKNLIFFKLDRIQDALDKQVRVQEQQAQVWHDIICLAETQLLATPDSKVSPEEKAKALLFYDRALILAHAKPCRATG